MSTHAYAEDQLVEQPAIQLFAALKWQTAAARGGTGRHLTAGSSGRAVA